jgi:hypothetical protein
MIKSNDVLVVVVAPLTPAKIGTVLNGVVFKNILILTYPL